MHRTDWTAHELMLVADRSAFPQRRGVVPGAKYYLRQAAAFLALADSIGDTELSARYRMMAQRYSEMASESKNESKETAADRRPGEDRPGNIR
jgi:hypothetical protein